MCHYFILDLTHWLGQEYRNIFVRFLVQMKTSKSHSEISDLQCLFGNFREIAQIAHSIRMPELICFYSTYVLCVNIFEYVKKNLLVANPSTITIQRWWTFSSLLATAMCDLHIIILYFFINQSNIWK